MGVGQSPLQEGATACKSLMLVGWKPSMFSDTCDTPKAPPLKVTRCSMKVRHKVVTGVLQPGIKTDGLAPSPHLLAAF